MNVINKSDIYDYIHEGFSGNQILDMIVFNEIPTVKAIPLDKVKNLRTEFDNSLQYYYTHTYYAPYTVMQYVLERIDEVLKPYE